MPSEKNIIKVKELQDTFSKARAVYFTEYHGLDVENITKLRSEFYKAKIEYKVAKNTLCTYKKEINYGITKKEMAKTKIS